MVNIPAKALSTPMSANLFLALSPSLTSFFSSPSPTPPPAPPPCSIPKEEEVEEEEEEEEAEAEAEAGAKAQVNDECTTLFCRTLSCTLRAPNSLAVGGAGRVAPGSRRSGAAAAAVS